MNASLEWKEGGRGGGWNGPPQASDFGLVITELRNDDVELFLSKQR